MHYKLDFLLDRYKEFNVLIEDEFNFSAALTGFRIENPGFGYDMEMVHVKFDGNLPDLNIKTRN